MASGSELWEAEPHQLRGPCFPQQLWMWRRVGAAGPRREIHWGPRGHRARRVEGPMAHRRLGSKSKQPMEIPKFYRQCAGQRGGRPGKLLVLRTEVCSLRTLGCPFSDPKTTRVNPGSAGDSAVPCPAVLFGREQHCRSPWGFFVLQGPGCLPGPPRPSCIFSDTGLSGPFTSSSGWGRGKNSFPRPRRVKQT